ncbi:MAG: hypothetical protein MZV65_22540 [Chromatiales bacterium]|nr:hypothetical protein [Chromatiales bacterium]
MASALSRLLTDRVLNARIAARGLEDRACVQFALEGRTVLFTLRVLGSPMKTHLSRGRGTLLIVAGEFPPLKTIGRIRTVKFVEHLRTLGWDAIVLTLEPSGQEPNYDAALAAEVPEGVEVVRVPLVTFDDRITAFVKRLLGREAAPRAGGADGAHGRRWRGCIEVPRHPGALSPSSIGSNNGSGLGLEIPDSYLPWALKALPAARRFVRAARWMSFSRPCRRSAPPILATGLPANAGSPGYSTIGISGMAMSCASGCRRGGGDWNSGWNGAWLSRASVVVTVSEQKTDYMRRLHPRLQCSLGDLDERLRP